ncbi:hypothetical protein [Micromonospora sp. LOL_021]|uniref:hypothetical protein n=1 Tax=Micromonospora sp. LOL_021 TaxID=3345417 RepID=UPI003A853A58
MLVLVLLGQAARPRSSVARVVKWRTSGVAYGFRRCCRVSDGSDGAGRVDGGGQFDDVCGAGGGGFDVCAVEVGGGQGGVAEGGAAGAALLAGAFGGFGGESYGFVGLPEVAEAVGGFAVQVWGVDKFGPDGFVVVVDPGEGLFGLGYAPRTTSCCVA